MKEKATYYQYYRIISLICYDLEYYRQMMMLSRDPYQKMFYENLLNNEMIKLSYWNSYLLHKPNNFGNPKPQNSINPINSPNSNQREFTLVELSQYDGSGGRPAYVAIDGIVYDVSLEATWGGGTHFSLYAGRDLTGQFNGCHGGRLEILRNLPIVGTIKDLNTD